MDECRWLIPLAVALAGARLRLLQPAASALGFGIGVCVVY
jgi:hypothetical protein